jgi:hypothetical protein
MYPVRLRRRRPGPRVQCARLVTLPDGYNRVALPAIIATYHATELGTAAAYVISGGADESNAMLADVEASLVAMGDAGAPIAASWEDAVGTEPDLPGPDSPPDGPGVRRRRSG